MNPHKRGPVRLGVLAVLQVRPLPMTLIRDELAKTMTVRSSVVSVTLQTMLHVGEICKIGTVAQARESYPGVPVNMLVYALTGTPKLPALVVPAAENRTKRARGSGVIAPAPYRMGMVW